MNCDEAFDALTDPRDCESAELETHLAGCPRCRQLQQVLEPARSLLCGELPAERVPANESRNEFPAAARPKPLLSVEAVGLAEAIAGQLALSSGKRVPAGPPLASRRVFVAALRGLALVLFGAMAVYCVSPRAGDFDSPALPAVMPASGPSKACTRANLQRKRGASQNAQSVILSCVACHLNDPQRQRTPNSTSLFWPPRSADRRISMVSCDERVGIPKTHSTTCDNRALFS
jgi:hypothetical protein